MKSIKNVIAISVLVILLLPGARLNGMLAAPVPTSSAKPQMSTVLTIGFIAIWGIMVANAVYNLLQYRTDKKDQPSKERKSA